MEWFLMKFRGRAGVFPDAHSNTLSDFNSSWSVQSFHAAQWSATGSFPSQPLTQTGRSVSCEHSRFPDLPQRHTSGTWEIWIISVMMFKRCLWGAFFFPRWWADVKESSRAGVADSPLAEMKNIIQDESLCWDGKRQTPFTVLWNWQEATETAAKASFRLCSFLI